MKKVHHPDLPGLAHDLNNVFQTLVGVAVQLEDNPELAATILRSVERGQKLVAGMQHSDSASTSFESITAKAAAFLHDFRMASNGPVVAVKTEIEAGIVLAGHGDWERVLINLFLNSLRAMPRGGTIEVTASHTGKGVEIRVADEGTGIAPELLEDLFQPHVSGNGSTGLGLSIVESIVQQSGGKVRAHNRERGAEFVITIPVGARAARA
jgi:signal transduction histidine kinase